jgi:hypothetical protein
VLVPVLAVACRGVATLSQHLFPQPPPHSHFSCPNAVPTVFKARNVPPMGSPFWDNCLLISLESVAVDRKVVWTARALLVSVGSFCWSVHWTMGGAKHLAP